MRNVGQRVKIFSYALWISFEDIMYIMVIIDNNTALYI